MKRFLVSTVLNGLGIWLVSAIIPGVHLKPYGGTGLWQLILTLLVIGAIFGVVNAVIAPVIKVIAIPLYILTFGLISVVINGARGACIPTVEMLWRTLLFAKGSEQP